MIDNILQGGVTYCDGAKDASESHYPPGHDVLARADFVHLPLLGNSKAPQLSLDISMAPGDISMSMKLPFLLINGFGPALIRMQLRLWSQVRRPGVRDL